MSLDLDQITQLSPPVVLVLALWVLGVALKKSPWSDWLIPFALPVAGAILFPLIAETGSVSYSVKSPTVFNGIIGFFLGGASVCFDQQIWQFFNRGQTADGKTALLKKSETVITTPESKP